MASDIAEKNIVLEEAKDQNILENVDENEKSLKVSETPNEIIIDLTQDLNKEKKLQAKHLILLKNQNQLKNLNP